MTDTPKPAAGPPGPRPPNEPPIAPPVAPPMASSIVPPHDRPGPNPAMPPLVHRRPRPSLVWLVPVLAAVIGLSLLVNTWLSAGPVITITFLTAAGLEAGKTPVRYKDVTVGSVSSIALSDDGSHVVATVNLVKSATNLTRDDTRFWVVRPRIGAGGVSGVDTLLSGAYIAVDVGESEAYSKTFTGLETPPTVIGGMPGTSFVLRATNMGSLDINSPVYYRRIQVGRLASYQIDPSGKAINIQVFIDSPYDRFVTTDTRFWNASGVDVSLGSDGLRLRAQSVATLISGGIAFDLPAGSNEPVAAENTEFKMADNEGEAMASPDGPAMHFQLRFSQALRGLSVGAPVQFMGLDFGRVTAISLDYDEATQRFPTVVDINVYPQRLGSVVQKLPRPAGISESESQVRMLETMVDQGLRAQARSGNLLTGQLFISLDFAPHAPKVAYDARARPLTLPTISGDFDQMQEQIASIVAKIERIPLDTIGRNLDSSLANLERTLRQINGQVLPQSTRTLQEMQQTINAARKAVEAVEQTLATARQGLLADDSSLQQGLGQTLQDTQRAMRSLRTLTDQLGRNPESLLRGLPAPAAPPPLTAPSAPAQESRR